MSRPAVLIAMAGIAIGLAVMIIAVAVVIGFKSDRDIGLSIKYKVLSIRHKVLDNYKHEQTHKKLRLILNT